MPEYLIYFNDEWVTETTDAGWQQRSRDVRAVVAEMKEAGVLIFTGGLDNHAPVFHVAPGEGTPVFTDGPFAETKEVIGGFAAVEVSDEAAARYWAGRIAVACDWPQEVRIFRNPRQVPTPDADRAAREAAQVSGSLHLRGGKAVVRLQARFATSVEELWSALTDRDRLALWLGEIDGDLRLGGAFRARFSASGWEGTGIIEECQAPHHLLVRTKDADGSNEGPIELTLTSDGAHTSVVWEEQVPPDLLAEYGAGIQIHVEDLVAHIGGHARSEARSRWDELIPDYRSATIED